MDVVTGRFVLAFVIMDFVGIGLSVLWHDAFYAGVCAVASISMVLVLYFTLPEHQNSED